MSNLEGMPLTVISLKASDGRYGSYLDNSLVYGWSCCIPGNDGYSMCCSYQKNLLHKIVALIELRVE